MSAMEKMDRGKQVSGVRRPRAAREEDEEAVARPAAQRRRTDTLVATALRLIVAILAARALMNDDGDWSRAFMFVLSSLGMRTLGHLLRAPTGPATSAQGAARRRSWWLEEVPTMSDARYRRNFRLSREAVQWVEDWLVKRPAFVTKAHAPRSGTTAAMDAHLQLHITLFRMAANHTEHAVAEQFGVSEASVHAAYWRVVTEIADGLPWVISDLFPTTAEKRQDVADEFIRRQKAGKTPFARCLGCADGSKVRIAKPADASAEHAFSGKEGAYCTSVMVSVACNARLPAAHTLY